MIETALRASSSCVTATAPIAGDAAMAMPAESQLGAAISFFA
jgi:hypothetical protein